MKGLIDIGSVIKSLLLISVVIMTIITVPIVF